MADAAGWVNQLLTRHTERLSRPELLRAIRALSARYVQRRSELGARSAIDSAGKRAAFAALYAPLHFFTVRAVVSALEGAVDPLTRIVDAGCGTGVASAAWALSMSPPAVLLGLDREMWPLDEARWNWGALGLSGRAARADIARPRAPHARTLEGGEGEGLVLGWTVNELADADRTALLETVLRSAARGTAILIVEPIARSAAPWWDDWARAVAHVGGRAYEWKLDVEVPDELATLDRDAGFDRQAIGVRAIWVRGRPRPTRA